MAKEKATEKKVVGKSTMLKIFISHKHKDKEVAMKICEKLRVYAAGKIDFYLSEDSVAGTNWNERIHDELKEADRLLLLYTDPTLEWDWCMYETGFFSRGLYDKQGKHEHRLICLHRPKDPIPEALRNWQSVPVTKGPISKMLTNLYKGINDDFLGSPESVEEVINIIIEAFSPELRRRHFSKYIHVCLDKEGIRKLTEEGVIPKKTKIKSDEKSLKLFNLAPKTEGEWQWKDIQEALTRSDQKTWEKPLIKDMANAYEDREFSRGLPLFTSGNDRSFYRPMLHRLDRMPNGISKFTVLFVPMEVDKTEGTIGNFNMVLTLLKLGHRFRWNVIEKYIHETKNISNKDTINQTLNDLDMALIKNESNARVMGIFEKNNIDLVFDEKGKQEYNKAIDNWNSLKKRISKKISKRDLPGVKDSLKEMRKMNTDFMTFITEKYHELFKSLG